MNKMVRASKRYGDVWHKRDVRRKEKRERMDGKMVLSLQVQLVHIGPSVPLVPPPLSYEPWSHAKGFQACSLSF